MLDDSAGFLQRLVGLQLTDLAPRFQELGWDSGGGFAYATFFNLQVPDEAKFKEEIVKRLTGDPNSPLRGKIQRLYMESYALAASEMRRRTEGGA